MSNDLRAIANLLETVSLGAPENAIGFVMWRLVHRYQRELDRALAPLDLTHLQLITLVMAAWLGRTGAAVTQTALARFGDVHPMQVSHMLKILESKAMVRRARSSTDIRAKHVEMTPAGLRALRNALPVAIDVQGRIFGEAGRPGGSLLDALLRLDDLHSETSDASDAS